MKRVYAIERLQKLSIYWAGELLNELEIADPERVREAYYKVDERVAETMTTEQRIGI